MLSLTRKLSTIVAAGLILSLVLTGCSVQYLGQSEIENRIPPRLLTRHDFSLADTPNKRTALAYLYMAWNDGRIHEARETFWVAGSTFERPLMRAPPSAERPPMMSPKYTIKKVIEERDQVVVLAFVEGVGIGDPITTIFGTPGGTKIGDAVVEIFQFDENGLIKAKWDTIEPLSNDTYDFR